ncbi:MAG: dTDP-4-dehydrorhamnose 3,5-epimerase [Syntrophales bacterium]|jgi:dTDP-4-dehydrorhamnose 3,5-epimerase|nr:dTDP-4-dehydrorhamnose 3,5-epimerase [Syntrophales bacterium]MDX9922915.1 dTDP-4-dehydrorhamnose 3,5-epimerase [Syntrophales bacterium]
MIGPVKEARFSVRFTPLDGLLVVQRKPLEDSRGFFSRFFCAEELQLQGFNKPISQINHTRTRNRGVVRGLHFQHSPHGEIKIVSCLAGEVFDVAVDIRKGSPTFLQWHGEILSAENHRSLLIPEGFAHGFQALTEQCEMLYLHSTPYQPNAEGALNIADPAIGIAWPLEVSHISERDRAHPFIGAEFEGIVP